MIKTFEIGKICEICLSPVLFFLHFSKSLIAENDFGHWSQEEHIKLVNIVRKPFLYSLSKIVS